MAGFLFINTAEDAQHFPQESWGAAHHVFDIWYRNVHRSQNRIESYHQLRSAIAQVGGKKELTGRTDIEIEISNQCARLIANAIIYYNSAILSRTNSSTRCN